MSSFSLFSGLYSGLAYSKKWEHLDAALALHFAYYNFCRVHSTIGCTPAVEAGLATETWSLQRLLEEAAQLA